MAETSRRLLALLSLLQTPREWPGPELAARLEVSQRTVRNDIGRLRDLGYPVEATRGPIGGYRLAAGQAMPPLLLDDEETIAVAVALGSASGGGISGLEESAFQALRKLQQVLPARLRRQVDVLQATTATGRVRRGGPEVAASLLTLIATAADRHEVLRFGYSTHAGEDSERRVEPVRLVNLGRRWYLVGYDVGRDDWRTFRVDRMREVRSVLHTFRPRTPPADDLAEWVAGKTRQVMARATGTVEIDVAADVVSKRMGSWASSVEVVGPERCRVRLSGRDPENIAFWLAAFASDFTVVEPPELAEACRRLGARFARAAGRRVPARKS